jgi:hypothetical protein
VNDYWIYWLAGLWDADKGSSAKGVVNIKNKESQLLAAFIAISTGILDINAGKIRVRLTHGYSVVPEVYYVSSRVRRMLERIVSMKEELEGNNARAFLAGKIDGDGYISDVKREIYIGYGLRHRKDADRDSKIALNLGVETNITVSRGIVKLRLHKPKYVACLIEPFILHPMKHSRLIRILSGKLTPTRGPNERDPRP